MLSGIGHENLSTDPHGWAESALEAGGAALRCFLKNMTDCYSDDKSTIYSADNFGNAKH